MNEYFDGSVGQLIARTQQLCDMIPRNLGRDVAALEVVCRDKLDEIANRLTELQRRPEMRDPRNQSARIRIYRRIRGDLEHVESVGISVLCRWNDEDRRINRFVDSLAQEIRYPLPTPVVSCGSQLYFHTFPQLRLVCVPLAEGRFLLHLPDLYHELGHSLLAFRNDARLAEFQRKQVEAYQEAIGYLDGEVRREKSGLGPQQLARHIETWIGCWPLWSIEFFCDLFALYVVGPAFAWAHLHLFATIGGDPFGVPLFGRTDHPSDAARMRALCHGLNRIGAAHERTLIEERWGRILQISGATMTPEYRRCFPEELIQRIEALAYEGALALGCEIATTPISGRGRSLLNEAWSVFWSSPHDYAEWERDAVTQVFGRLT